MCGMDHLLLGERNRCITLAHGIIGAFNLCDRLRFAGGIEDAHLRANFLEKGRPVAASSFTGEGTFHTVDVR